MTYGGGGPDGRLHKYVNDNMHKQSLALGVSADGSGASDSGPVRDTEAEGYGGIMVYDVSKESKDYLNQIANAEQADQKISVVPGCLR